MSQSTLIVEIGRLLGGLTEQLRLYDQDYSVTKNIDVNIQLIKEVIKLHGFNINFQSLRDYRSVYMPQRGESFIEKHGFLNADLEEYLEEKYIDIARTARFFANPLSLRGLNAPGMSRFFPSQVQ